MAERRMFSKRIISSARFAKMPLSTQALYFHLSMHADDDGIVEGYSVMRSIGAAEDELKLLAAKGFVKVLNEDLVTYILDWSEHNTIRADRKIDSIYKNLLLQVLGENIVLVDKKPRSDTKQGRNEILQIQAGQSTDSPRSVHGQHRLGKVSIDKISNIYPPQFEFFWNAYPKKAGKPEALKSWLKLKPDDELVDRIISGAKGYAKYCQMKQTEQGFIKNAQGWLNGRRWEDVLALPDISQKTKQKDVNWI